MAVLTLEQAQAFANQLRREGHRLVVTDGTFDLLLPAHVRALEAARARGDALLVLVHSDRGTPPSVTRLTPEDERAEIVAALASVDAAAVVNASGLAGAIERLTPVALIPSMDQVLLDPESVNLMSKILAR